MKRNSHPPPQRWRLTPKAIENPLLFSYKYVLRFGRYWYYRLIRAKASPEYLARGFAVGVFAGFFPFFGTQTALSVLLAIPLRGHKLTAALGTWVSNPLTYIPIYWFNFRVGCWLLGTHASFTSQSLQSLEALLELKKEFFATLLVGCFVCGLVGSFFSYFIVSKSIRSWKNRRESLRIRAPRPDASPSELKTPR